MSEQGKVLQKDLRLIFTLTENDERYISLDKLLEQFQKKITSNDSSEISDKDILGRFSMALIMLKNLGFFGKSSHRSVWKKTFYKKSEFRTCDSHKRSYKF